MKEQGKERKEKSINCEFKNWFSPYSAVTAALILALTVWSLAVLIEIVTKLSSPALLANGLAIPYDLGVDICNHGHYCV